MISYTTNKNDKMIILLLYKLEQINMNLEFSSDGPNYITKVYTRISLEYKKLTQSIRLTL
jgi:hypothetical protein